jgi:hypothetical protein
LSIVYVLLPAIDPRVSGGGHRTTPRVTFALVDLTGDQWSKVARLVNVDFAVFVVAVAAVWNHWHNLTPKTKSNGGLVQRHVGTLERGRQEVVVLR